MSKLNHKNKIKTNKYNNKTRFLQDTNENSDF